MTTEEIIKYIANDGSLEFKCYDTLRMLLDTKIDFRETISTGIKEGKITGFNPELWKKLGEQNMMARGYDSFLDVLRLGQNQGYCTVASRQVSFSLNGFTICGGTLPILKGTANCPDGSHTWIETSDKIIDTTFVLEIDKSYRDKIGYNKENEYNMMSDPRYNSARDFANDTSLRKHR